MTITKEQLEQLTRIYNTMLHIGTRGEDTLIMSDCLRALEQVVVQIDKAAKQAEQPDTEIVEG